MKRKLLMLCVTIGFAHASAQRVPVSVDRATGTINVAIPILNAGSGSISVPIVMGYSSRGIQIENRPSRTSQATPTGWGWALQAGGQISRNVRGLPDDVKKNAGGAPMLGWIYSANGAKINSFTIVNDNNPSVCTDEQADLTYINSNFNNYNDTEPDIFSINVPGLSCQFVFDKDSIMRTLSYQDIRIMKTTDPASGLITSFIVTNDKGVKYYFSETTTATKRTKFLYPADNGAAFPVDNLKYFKTQFYQYAGLITYNDAWLLTNIIDPNGNQVQLTYNSIGSSGGEKWQQLDESPGDDSGVTDLSEYTLMYLIEESKQSKHLATIVANGDTYTFNYSIPNAYENDALVNINAKGVNYNFYYGDFAPDPMKAVTSATFLRSITTDQPNSPLNYYFSYVDQTGTVTTPFITSATAADPWGYYMGNSHSTLETGAVSTTNVMVGMLKQILYYDSGTTEMEYESNSYYNAGSTVYGGGARVKKITDYDGINSANNIVRNYSYLNPSSQSSGVPLALPKFSHDTPAGEVFAGYDLARDDFDETIMYTHVKESQTGKGSILYEYNVPGGAFDSSVPLSDWTPTVSYSATPGCTVSRGSVSNGAFKYPFAPNPNYNFERGLLKKETVYNEGGTKVAETSYTYQRSSSPLVIQALRLDDNDYVKVYSKYNIYAGTSNLITQIDKKVFDPSSTTVGKLDVSKLYYTGSTHKNVTVREDTNSDGTITKTYTTYTKDYNSSTQNTATYSLVTKNINIPVETYTQVLAPGGGSYKTTSAQFIDFGLYNTAISLQTLHMPRSILKLVAADGITGFVPTVTTNASSPDSHYITTTNTIDYGKSGNIKSSIGMDRTPQALIADQLTQLPLAAFGNAGITEVAYNNIEDDANNPEAFTKTGSYTTVTDRSGRSALQFTSTGTFSKSLTKRSLVKNYIFAAWIKNSSSAGSFTVSAAGSATQTVALNYATGASWKYYEVKIPVSGLTDNFTISFTAGSAIAIDDILVYPDISAANSYCYDAVTHQTLSETNTSGISTYYDKDKFGRVNLIYDQDKNITYKKARNYVFNYPASAIPPAIFNLGGISDNFSFYPGIAYSFNPVNSYSIFSGVSYSWNFGDGGTATTSNPAHAYSTAGSYNVTLTVTVAGLGSQTYTTQVEIITPPPPPVTMAALYFINNTSASGLTKMEFRQGSTLKYTVLSTAVGFTQILPGAYSVKVFCYGEDTDICISTLTDSSEADAKSWIHSNQYTFAVDIADNFTLTLNAGACE
ncbi:PKD domain-containing protein [Mucilaginibacter sp. HD30]